MEEIKVNFENLTEEEKEILMNLVKKSNKTSKVWKPKLDEDYWFIGSNGIVFKVNRTIENWHDKRNSFGNCFQTEEEAKNAVERLKIRAELQRYADEHNEEIDWTVDSDKWYIIYNHKHKTMDVNSLLFSQNAFQMYFSSEEIARNAIQAVGEDRIKNTCLGWNDD